MQPSSPISLRTRQTSIPSHDTASSQVSNEPVPDPPTPLEDDNMVDMEVDLDDNMVDVDDKMVVDQDDSMVVDQDDSAISTEHVPAPAPPTPLDDDRDQPSLPFTTEGGLGLGVANAHSPVDYGNDMSKPGSPWQAKDRSGEYGIDPKSIKSFEAGNMDHSSAGDASIGENALKSSHPADPLATEHRLPTSPTPASFSTPQSSVGTDLDLNHGVSSANLDEQSSSSCTPGIDPLPEQSPPIPGFK